MYGELLKPDSELSSPRPSIAVSEMLASMKVDKLLFVFAKDKKRYNTIQYNTMFFILRG